MSNSTSVLWNSAACDPTPLFPKLAIFDQGTDTNDTQSSAEWKRCVPMIAQQRGVAHNHVEGGAEDWHRARPRRGCAGNDRRG